VSRRINAPYTFVYTSTSGPEGKKNADLELVQARVDRNFLAHAQPSRSAGINHSSALSRPLRGIGNTSRFTLALFFFGVLQPRADDLPRISSRLCYFRPFHFATFLHFRFLRFVATAASGFHGQGVTFRSLQRNDNVYSITITIWAIGTYLSTANARLVSLINRERARRRLSVSIDQTWKARLPSL